MSSAKLSYQEIVFLGSLSWAAWACSGNGVEPHSLFMLKPCVSPQQDICHLICIAPQLGSFPSPKVLSPLCPSFPVACFIPFILCRSVLHCRWRVSAMVQRRLLMDLWPFAASCHPLSHVLVKQHKALSLI